MGSFEDSKYVTGRGDYRCTRCQASIPKGERHLTYRVGLMNNVRVCATCSTLLDADARPIYWCQVVLNKIKADNPGSNA